MKYAEELLLSKACASSLLTAQHFGSMSSLLAETVVSFAASTGFGALNQISPSIRATTPMTLNFIELVIHDLLSIFVVG